MFANRVCWKFSNNPHCSAFWQSNTWLWRRKASFERLWMDLHLWLGITRFGYTIRSQSPRKSWVFKIKEHFAVYFQLILYDKGGENVARVPKCFFPYNFTLYTYSSFFFPGLFPAVLNLASMADITANATCGSLGPEMFCKLVEHVPGQPVRNPQCRICNQRSAKPFGRTSHSDTSLASRTRLQKKWSGMV